MKLPFHGGVCAAAEVALGAVQRERVEAGDHDLALGPDHAIRLAQHEVRVVGELERVRQHDQVDRVLRERQAVRIGDDVRGRVVVERPARRDAALREERRTRAGRSAARGSRRCRRPSGRNTPARARGGSGRAASRTSPRASVDTLAAGPEDASMAAIIPIPAFADNYIWLLREGTIGRGRRSRRCGAGARLPRRAKGSRSRAILATHHHATTSAAIAALLARCRVPGVRPRARDDSRRARARLAKATRRRARASPCDVRRARHSRPHGGPHRATSATVGGAPVGVLRRHAVRRGLRPAVRRHAAQMWTSLSQLAALPPDDARVLRPRIHAREPALRARGRAGQRRDCRSAQAREQAKRDARRAHAAVDDRRGARHQSVPARREPAVRAAAASACRARAGRRRRDVRRHCGRGRTRSVGPG